MSKQFKKGDRVRVSYEGEVVFVGSSTGVPAGIDIETPAGTRTVWSKDFGDVELVAPAEPVWVNGDVICFNWTGEAVRVNGKWIGVHSGLVIKKDASVVSKDWRDGSIEVLYKAEA